MLYYNNNNLFQAKATIGPFIPPASKPLLTETFGDVTPDDVNGSRHTARA